jgi:hypothetical protein
VSKIDVVGGLRVASLRGEGNAWEVLHDDSGHPLFRNGFLRQKRFAVEARAEFLATGVDFTRTARELTAEVKVLSPVLVRWQRRVVQDRIDLVTGEHYSWSTHYGQVIPSAVHAKRLAEALASYVWS